MLRRKRYSGGALYVLPILAMASLAVGYGLWSKTLTIQGTVYTGEVNAEFSIEEVDEGEPHLVHDDGINEDHEFEGKDVAECVARLIETVPPDLDNPGPQLMEVVVYNGYPSFHCFVNFNVKNTGTIPIRLHLPELVSIDPGLLVEFTTPTLGGGGCYFHEVNGVWDGGTPDPHPQLHPGEEIFCTLHLHVEQSAPQGATLTYRATILAHQWNEEP